MGYVAVKGGKESIEMAENFLEYRRFSHFSKPLETNQIIEQLHFLVDKVMSEGSLYSPEVAAIAIKQAAGDVLEASFMVRAYRTTLPKIGYSVSKDTSDMRVIRRISSAFKDIPGGQILGPTSDYKLKLIDFSLKYEDKEKQVSDLKEFLDGINLKEPIDGDFPKVLKMLREEGLVVAKNFVKSTNEIVDVTKETLNFPADRSAAMQTMARGETGGMLALAYSNMRGYGSAHPTIGELRVGYLPIYFEHPYTKEKIVTGEILVSEAEILSKITIDDKTPKFSVGYGICFGHNETKAISMATLDAAMVFGDSKYPSEDQEFVLSHIDSVESMGFANHFKLPHYVTFQSSLDRLRHSQTVQ